MKFFDNIFNRIKPQDITLVQADWKTDPDNYTHIWIASYYGELIGKVTYNYLRETWQVIGQLYCKTETLISEDYMHKDIYDYGAEDVSEEEINELRKCQKTLSRYLNKNNYKHGNK